MLLGIPIIASTKERRNLRGFSLLELLAVLGIMAVLAAVSLPISLGFLRAMRLTSASQSVVGLIEEARAKALAGQNYVWLGLSQDSARKGVWVVLLDSGKAPSAASTDLRLLSKPVFLEGMALKEAGQIAGMAEAIPELSDPATDDVLKLGEGSGVDPFSPIASPAGMGGASHFDRLVLFSPRGEALARKNNFSRWIVIGMAPEDGAGQNAAVFQISGLTAQCVAHRL
jgi:prepilin-type N-terminal cleavage/methylation domain-containing protein